MLYYIEWNVISFPASFLSFFERLQRKATSGVLKVKCLYMAPSLCVTGLGIYLPIAIIITGLPFFLVVCSKKKTIGKLIEMWPVDRATV